MPLVRISISDSFDKDRRKVLPQAVYDAMRASISIPEHDLFVVLTAHAEGELVVDPGFMGMQRTSEFVLIHITLRNGRSTEVKQSLYREIAAQLNDRAGIASDDVMVVLTENESSDWSFGKGEAQYVATAGGSR